MTTKITDQIIELPEQTSAPATPSTGQAVLYVLNTKDFAIKWADGTVTTFGGASALNDLSDVVITSAASGETVVYNGANWVNAALNLSQLGDTNITSPTDGQVLSYDNASGKWVNSSSAGASTLNDLTDVSAAAPSQGDSLVHNGSTWINEPKFVGILSDNLSTPATMSAGSTMLIDLDIGTAQVVNGNAIGNITDTASLVRVFRTPTTAMNAIGEIRGYIKFDTSAYTIPTTLCRVFLRQEPLGTAVSSTPTALDSEVIGYDLVDNYQPSIGIVHFALPIHNRGGASHQQYYLYVDNDSGDSVDVYWAIMYVWYEYN
ncbi:MAG: hypothetical protein D6706_01260 [Chloroflexi bacterium]|nr:MAG: hypothetical protein D6706_01260 [Chloroflexota bacterium]